MTEFDKFQIDQEARIGRVEVARREAEVISHVDVSAKLAGNRSKQRIEVGNRRRQNVPVCESSVRQLLPNYPHLDVESRRVGVSNMPESRGHDVDSARKSDSTTKDIIGSWEHKMDLLDHPIHDNVCWEEVGVCWAVRRFGYPENGRKILGVWEDEQTWECHLE